MRPSGITDGILRYPKNTREKDKLASMRPSGITDGISASTGPCGCRPTRSLQ